MNVVGQQAGLGVAMAAYMPMTILDPIVNSVGSSGGLAMPKYFVWRFSSYNPYRAYGIRNHVEPDSNDPRCIWRGDSLKEARDMAKKANKQPTFHSWLEELK